MVLLPNPSNTDYNLVRFGVYMIKVRHERMLILRCILPPKKLNYLQKKLPPPHHQLKNLEHPNSSHWEYLNRMKPLSFWQNISPPPPPSKKENLNFNPLPPPKFSQPPPPPPENSFATRPSPKISQPPLESPPRKFLNPPPKISHNPPENFPTPHENFSTTPENLSISPLNSNPTRKNINPKNMLRGNLPPPTSLFFLSISENFTFTMKIFKATE